MVESIDLGDYRGLFKSQDGFDEFCDRLYLHVNHFGDENDGPIPITYRGVIIGAVVDAKTYHEEVVADRTSRDSNFLEDLTHRIENDEIVG